MHQGLRRTWTAGGRGIRIVGSALTLVALLAIGVTMSSGVIRAQDMATPETTGAVASSIVSVSGHGEVSIPPDTASISIGVDVTKPTLAEAQAQATEQATAVIATLKDAGIASKDIQTTYYNVNILYDTSKHGDPTKITGFEITNQLQVTVRDTAILGQVLDKVVKSGANNISGVSFYVDDQTAAAREARRFAVEDAMTKAEELAAAAGLTRGPVLTIYEGAQSPIVPLYGVADGAMGKFEAPVPVEAGSSAVVVDVSMAFALR
jgi:uncharacterized protein YggE